MCRIVLASGQFSVEAVFRSALLMSRGMTATHDHPMRKHADGWGAVWRSGRTLACFREVRQIPQTTEQTPLAGLSTDFLAIHVRKATFPENVTIAKTHPIESKATSTAWYMMHNGYLPNVYRAIGRSQSVFDTEEYLEYLVPSHGATLRAEEVRTKLESIEGTLCANAVVVNEYRAYLIQWFPESTPYPEFYTMKRLHNDRATYISSEIIPALAHSEQWTPLDRFSFLTFEF